MPHGSVQAILDEFAVKLETAPLRLDDAGWCSLALDDLVIHLEAQDGSAMLSLNAWLGEVPLSRRVEVAQAVADANYLLMLTQGTTLGLNRSTGDLAIVIQIGVTGLTLAKFEQILSNFAAVGLRFRERLLGDETSVSSSLATGARPDLALRV